MSSYNTYVTYTGNGSTSTFAIPFSYESEGDVLVFLDTVASTSHSFSSPGNITFTPPPGTGVKILIARDTDVSAPAVVWGTQTVLGKDINTLADQYVYKLQELATAVEDVIPFIDLIPDAGANAAAAAASAAAAAASAATAETAHFSGSTALSMERIAVGDTGSSGWSLSVKTPTSDSSKFAFVARDSGGNNVGYIRADGQTFFKGPITVGPTLASYGPVQPNRHFYVQMVDTDTDASHGHTAIETRCDAQPGSNSNCNYDGIYGTLWLNAPVAFTGQPAAVRGNSYVINQTGGTISVDQLSGVYGRVRNESAGTVAYASALLADGNHNVGGGALTLSMGLRMNPQTAGVTNHHIWMDGEPNGGSIRVSNNNSFSAVVSGTGTHKLTTAGGTVTINAAGQIVTTTQGNVLGQADGSASSPTADTMNVLLYKVSSTNYAGWSADTSGNPYLVSGTTSPECRLSFSVDSGAMRLWGYGSGTLTTDASGNVTATSDGTLKNVHREFTRGLSAVLSLSPVVYSWREDSGFDPSGEYAGLIAQEVQQVIPEAVGSMPDGKLTLQDRPIIMALVNAIKELSEDIATVRAELAEIRKGG